MPRTYTTEGEIVTTFGKEGSNEGDFNCPVGVCVDKDAIFINTHSHCDLGNGVQLF